MTEEIDESTWDPKAGESETPEKDGEDRTEAAVATVARTPPSPPSAPAVESPPVRTPSTLVAGFAAVLPTGFLLGAVVLLVLITHEQGFGHAMQMMGVAALMVVMTASCIAWLGTTVMAFLVAKGFRVPSALLIGFAAMPWLAGLLGMAWGVRLASSAIANADSTSRGTMMAVATGEASQARVFGAVLSSALFAASALAMAIGALNQRAPEKRPAVAAALGVVSGVPFILLGLYAASGSTLIGALIVLAGLGASITIGLGATGVGVDGPRARSGALASGAALLAGLSVTGLALAGGTELLATVFQVSAFAAPSQHATRLAEWILRAEPALVAARWSVAAVLVAVVAVAAWAGVRVRPSPGRIAGGVAAMLVTLGVLGADHLTDGYARSELGGPTADWSAVDGFEPVRLEGPGVSRARTDALLTAEGLLSTDGRTLAPLEARALETAFQRLVATREARFGRYGGADPYDDVPEWLRDEQVAHETPATESVSTDPMLEIAVDARVDGATLRQALGAASRAGVRSVVVIGVWENTLDPAIADHISAIHPASQGMLSSTLAIEVSLESGIPSSLSDRDPTLLHGTVEAEPLSRFSARAGADASPEELSIENPRAFPTSTRDLVYLAIGERASAASLFATAARAANRELRPVIVTTEIPGHPETPLAEDPTGALGVLRGLGAHPNESTLGTLGEEPSFGGLGLRGVGPGPGTGPGVDGPRAPLPGRSVQLGQPDVRGSLSREVIRRVIREHVNEVQFCYEQGLATRPELEGRVLVSFIIAPTGSVQSATVASTTLSDAGVESCIVQAVRRWVFPEPDGGGIVGVNYPFILQSGE